MRFEDLGLKGALQKGVEEAGYKELFPIQERAIGALLEGKNVIGQAKTGSGKTAAFGLPLLNRIDASKHSIQALVLAPTRELAQQVASELGRLGKHTDISILPVFGGQSINVQLDGLRRGVQVVVGTPGRLIDHMRRGTLNLRKVGFVVIDEADRMLDMGFIDDVSFILDATPSERQVALFSATMPEQIVRLSEQYIANPEKILIDSDEPSVETLEQYYTVVAREEKLDVLIALLKKGDILNAIVFCRTRLGAHRLAKDLEKRYLNAVPLHGDLSQAQRDHSMGLFRSGRVDVLVATDVASRGIDIVHVDCVVNYDVPEDPLIYFHRVGRTARAGRTGKSYTLVSRDEFGDFARILGLTKVKIQPLNAEDGQYSFGTYEEKEEHREGRRGRSDVRRWSRGRRARFGRRSH